MAIIGAILGDIAGSRWEFGRPDNLDWKHIELYTEKNSFTDDTVLSIATKYAIENHVPFACAYHIFGNQYPYAGYGGSFHTWLVDDELKPYNSFGNGSAMRVSYIIDMFDKNHKPGDVAIAAQDTAICTHNHPEGVKGAVVTAVVGWMAKCGASKKEIEEYVIEQYPSSDYLWSVEKTLDEIREDYKWDVTCQGSVPVAIRCFLESEDYESFLRNVLSLKCDTDTLCAIGGGIAEEFYHGTNFDNVFLLQKYLDTKLYNLISDML